MPTVSVGSFIPRISLGPDRIIQNPQDDIDRRLKLAQIARLEAEPGLAEREFQERAREFNVGQGFREKELGETSRYHDVEAQSRAEQLAFAKDELEKHLGLAREQHHQQIADSLIKMGPYYGVGKDVIADVLKRNNYPELANSFAAAHETEQTTKAQQVVTALKAASTNPKQYQTLLKGLEGVDKDMLNRIRSSMPENLRSTLPSTGGKQDVVPPVLADSAIPESAPMFSNIPSGRGEFQGDYPLKKRSRGLLSFDDTIPSYVNPSAVYRPRSLATSNP